jgi:hypothetical protein
MIHSDILTFKEKVQKSHLCISPNLQKEELRDQVPFEIIKHIVSLYEV